MKDLVGKPIGNRKLASVSNNLFLVNMKEEKLKDLNKKYSRPKNCPRSPQNVTLKFGNLI